MSTAGFLKAKKGDRIDNIPNTGVLTGFFSIDFYGCWWEVYPDAGTDNFWMIGEYPN